MTTMVEELPTLWELFARAVEHHGSRTFLVDAAGEETFARTGEQVERVAATLAAAGVGQGDRVVIQGVNSIPLVHAWLGAMRQGALPVCVNPTLTPHELDVVLGDVEPRALLTDAACRRGAEPIAAPRGVWLAQLDTVGGGAAPPAPPPPPALASDPAMLVYTSGTTSRPKAVIVTHAALVLSGEAFPSWVGLGEDERLWACLPLFHMNAQAYSLATAIAHGYSLAISTRFSASGFWREAAALEVTAANVIGAMLEILARSPEEHWAPSKLRMLYTSPAPPPARRRELEQRFGVRLTSGYGMSEVPFGCIDSDTSREKATCIGKPRLHPWRPITNELRIVDEDGLALPAGEVGELQLRNATTSPGYWNAADGGASRRSPEGWLSTGDTGYLDGDGDVILVGRLKEMIRRRGENIAPGEIEAALMEHPAVLLAAAVGIPSELSEEDVAAAVVLRDGAEVAAEELRAWCSERLAPYKVPARVEIRASLPMTPTMRVSRRELARQIAAGPTGPAPVESKRGDHA
jgi:crotonobetaine/carnitine-CoA ligase